MFLNMSLAQIKCYNNNNNDNNNNPMSEVEVSL